jgi:hypothetical protein
LGSKQLNRVEKGPLATHGERRQTFPDEPKQAVQNLKKKAVDQHLLASMLKLPKGPKHIIYK